MAESGRVYLVGAGPGDPGLLTIKAVECLEKADVVIYDRLLSERLLSRTRPDIEKIFVGKSPSKHTVPQADINKLLVEKANEGKCVVRLKGGDPFVFGRGGEEAEELVNNKIAFEIVPGVTSAVAVPAYAGIPVTHRKLASSFAVITGHEDPSKIDTSIQWAKLSAGIDTLVFVMGMGNLPEIVAKLVEYGRPVDTPVAVISEGTMPQQKVIACTLKDIVSRTQEHGLEPPAVIIVGDVVRLREKIRWFDNSPLFGKRILVTRAKHQSSSLSKLLADKGALPVELPAINIQPISGNSELREAVTNLAKYQWLILTSINGVDAFFDALSSQNLDSRALYNLKIVAIGPATAESLRRKGIIVDFQPEIFTSRGIIVELKKYNVKGQYFLLPRADIADEELSHALIEMGAKVQEIATYRTLPDIESVTKAKEMLLNNQIDIITFTSSSTVVNLMNSFTSNVIPLNGISVACIGPKTAETARKFGLRPDIVAKKHTISGLVTAIEEFFRGTV